MRYVALLRAINVGGHAPLRMADLRSRLESLGLADVATYIQTGNVLFSSGEVDPEALARKIEERLEASFGYRGKVFVLTPEQLKRAAANNPFTSQCAGGEQRCHLMFLDREPAEDRLPALLALQGEEYRIALRERVLYYKYPRAFDGRRRTIDFEKVLGVVGTARNWGVVQRLISLAG